MSHWDFDDSRNLGVVQLIRRDWGEWAAVVAGWDGMLVEVALWKLLGHWELFVFRCI